MNFKDFINQHRRWIRLVLKLFALSVIAGIAAAFYYPDLINEIVGSFAERFGEDPALNFDLALQIFLQNLTASIVAWLGGVILGIAPVLAILVNGFILGYVLTFLVFSTPEILNNILFAAAGLLPHGIIEIPAFLVAAVLGLRLGLVWLTKEASGRRWEVFRTSLWETSQYFFLVVIALVAAALIEVFISGTLVDKF